MTSAAIYCPLASRSAIWSSSPLNPNYSDHEQRERCSPSQAEFLLRCPYLVSCSSGTRERERKLPLKTAEIVRYAPDPDIPHAACRSKHPALKLNTYRISLAAYVTNQIGVSAGNG